MKSRFQRTAFTTLFVGALLAAPATFAAGDNDQQPLHLNAQSQLVGVNINIGSNVLDIATEIINIILKDIPISEIIG